MALDESKNLFLVLGTGSFAKPPLPPSRMLLQEGITEPRGEANWLVTSALNRSNDRATFPPGEGTAYKLSSDLPRASSTIARLCATGTPNDA